MEKPEQQGSELPFLGSKLRELRELRGLSRQELAQRTEPPLSRAYIYLLEGASEDDPPRRPSYGVVFRLAKALDVEPTAFFEHDIERLAMWSPPNAKWPEELPVTEDLPKGLHEAAERFQIPDDDVVWLASFGFRGLKPRSAADWAQLWMAVRKSVGLELP
jgi:transcriptional regulator with XRE-family HTH domain